jgi:hypothetical protein
MSVKIQIPEMRLIPVEEIEPNNWNPNEMSNDEFDWLVEEITEVGFIDPLEVVPMVDGGFRILGGAHRHQAAKALGMAEVPCVVLSDAKWQDADLQKFVTVRLNQLHGKANPDKMIALYRELETKYGEKSMQRLFAYTDDDAWKKLIKQMKKSLKAAGLPKDVQQKFDAASANAKGIDDLGLILNKIFHDHGDTLQHSFMVFSYGGKEHTYVAMSKQTRNAVALVLDHCKSWGKDVNEVIGKLTEAWVKEAEAQEQEELQAQAS